MSGVSHYSECVVCKVLYKPWWRGTEKFCSLQCQANNRRNLKVKEWLETGTLGNDNSFRISNYIRSYLIDEAKHKCETCGWSKINPSTNKVPLEIDHIDGNHQNNKRENLRVICACCHSLTPTYRGLNRGKGRAYRNKKTA